MPPLDIFTKRRLQNFVTEFRKKSGQLPTLQDFDQNGFDSDVIKTALKEGLISQFYVTLTNGTIVKGYRLGDILK